jgi:tetratricopeptide (TPR) repeat protein
MNEANLLKPIDIGALVMLVNQDRLSEAEQIAGAMLTVHPNAGMLWKILSVALVRQGKDALQALRRTTELLPQDAEAHCNLGAALHDREQWAAALASLQRALAIQPNHVEALVDAANSLRGLRRASEAVPFYQRALELDPRLVEAHNNLGNAFLELGRYDDAAGCYRRAMQIRPDDAQILCNLSNAQGLIHAALGQREQAVASYRQALIHDPSYADAWNNLGNVLRDLGAVREAVALYARAIELDSGRAKSHYNIGTVLFELRRVDEAVASYRQALVIQPDYAPAHASLGSALRQQRRPADAELSCRAALDIDPNCFEALYLLGELRADRGQFVEAQEIFRRTIEINPNFSFAYSSIATHRKMTRYDTQWLEGATALLAKQPPLAQAISLRYSLGKYFDDVGHYDDAFNHYRQANELTRRHGSIYNGTNLTRRVDGIIRIFDVTFMREDRNHAPTSEVPVFIVGMPRSGTSLAEQILASHPAVFGAGEVIFWDAAYRAYREAERKNQQDANLIPGMATAYLEHLTTLSRGAQRVIDKMPANFLYAGLIHAALPRARIIHMQRHPIDTCLSIYFQNFFNMGAYANDLDDLAHYYGEYIRITNHWRAVLPAATLLEIPYEALIEDPEGWARRMLDFIGLPWDPKCLNFHQTDRAVITASKWQVRQKISKSSAGRWRNYQKFVAPLQHLVNLPVQAREPDSNERELQ